MSKHDNLAREDVFPEHWTDAIQEFISTMVSRNFKLERATATTLRIPAGAGDDQVTVGIDGKWRYITAAITAAHPGGGAGVYNVWVTANPNSYTNVPDPDTDLTDYSFFLMILPVGSTPSGAGNQTHYDKVGEIYWDGAAINETRQLVGAFQTYNPKVGATDSVLLAGIAGDTQARFKLQADGKMEWGPGNAVRDTNLYRDGSGGTLALTSDTLIRVYRPLVTDTAFSSRVVGDGTGRYQVRADGRISWGDGVAGVDVNLYRSAADLLKTDDSLEIARSGGATTLNLSSTTFGVGLTIGGDVDLYRSAADLLKTDDSFEIARAGGKTTLALTNVGLPVGMTIGGDVTLYRDVAGVLATDNHLRIYRTATSDSALSTRLAADTAFHWRVLADGTMAWTGDGSTLEAMTLFRSAANELALSGDFRIKHTTAPGDGSSTNSRRLRIEARYDADDAPGNVVDTGYAMNLVTTMTAVGAAPVGRLNVQREDLTAVLKIESDGKVYYGTGTSVDANLYRQAASILGTDASFAAMGTAGVSPLAGAAQGVYMNRLGGLDVARSSANAAMLRLYVVADANPRVRVGIRTSDNQGSLEFGDGTAALDTTLFRDSVTGGLVTNTGFRVRTTVAAVTALTRTMLGLELSALGASTTNKYQPPIKWMSADPELVTENPKLLALITGRATELYDADTKGGMAIDFATTPNTPGATSLPTISMTLSQTGALLLGTVTDQAARLVAEATSGEALRAHQVAGNVVLGNRLLVGDANRAFHILGDGKHEWGAGGGSAVDVSMHRRAAGSLQITGTAYVTGAQLLLGMLAGAGTAGLLKVNNPLSSDQTFITAVDGDGGSDTQTRFAVLADGKHEWGSGSGARDVNLYRTSGVANVLKTDDQFIAIDGIQTKSFSGAGRATVADGDFTATPNNGALAVLHNTTDGISRLAARVNGVWKYVAIA